MQDYGGNKSRNAFAVIDTDEAYAAFGGGSGAKDDLITEIAGADGELTFGNDSEDGSTRTYDMQLVGEISIKEIDGGDVFPSGKKEKFAELTAIISAPDDDTNLAALEALHGAKMNLYAWDALNAVNCAAHELLLVNISVKPVFESLKKPMYEFKATTTKHGNYTNITLTLT